MTIQTTLIGAVAAGVLMAAVAGGCTYREHQKMQAKVDTANAATAAAQHDLVTAQENERKANVATKGFIDENEALKAAIAAQPAPGSVRCRVSTPHRPAEAAASSSADVVPTPRAGTLPEEPEHDTGNISSALYRDADQCDGFVNELRHLREWAKSVSD